MNYMKGFTDIKTKQNKTKQNRGSCTKSQTVRKILKKEMKRFGEWSSQGKSPTSLLSVLTKAGILNSFTLFKKKNCT